MDNNKKEAPVVEYRSVSDVLEYIITRLDDMKHSLDMLWCCRNTTQQLDYLRQTRKLIQDMLMEHKTLEMVGHLKQGDNNVSG